MNEFWATQVKHLPYSSLHDLVQDAERRIGSHVAGGNINQDYIDKQESLMLIAQEEIIRRSKRDSSEDSST